MIVGILFIIARASELFFLIPIIGMLSWFVDQYVDANQLTPDYILVLFIVSVIAGVWALGTLVFYAAARHNGYLIAFIDICIFGGLIAGVYYLRGVAGQDCGSFDTTSYIYRGSGVLVVQWDRGISVCNMLKGCFGLAILEILMFFWTFILALWIHHHHRHDYDDRSTRRVEKHYSRHSNRRGGSRSGSGTRSRSRDYDRRRSGSRGYNSSRRSYVV